ncbi:pyrimidine 5'-nucleotidase [Amaricoccus macauensis]|uniref:pyrimidine 5'-nucleotidase n=1 Tax=Amaricoccus macauensis TaxID=57001 RepID=UPI003C7EC1C3
MTKARFTHITTWVFDLDNTLYPPEMRLFDQIEARMTDYVMRELGVDYHEANSLRARYWREHGTTLAGLMQNHGLEPEAYLAEVHDIDLTAMARADDLREAILALSGRKVVYTNGSREHARRVIAARGLEGVFDATYGIEDADYHPKPSEAAFARVFAIDGFETGRAAMFEDDPRNLAVPHALGMRTVLVGPGEPAPHIHHHTTDLAEFLVRLI